MNKGWKETWHTAPWHTAVTCGLLGMASLLGCGGARHAELSDGEREARMRDMYEDYAAAFPDVPDVDVETLLAWQKEKDVLLIDARSEAEQAVSRIPGAISRETFEETHGEHAEGPVVVYCTIGYRSARYADELRSNGWEAYNLAGSVLAWAHEGKTFVTPKGVQTERVHVYGARWNLLPRGYEAVW